MKRTPIYITADQASKIEELAHSRRVSKAEVIRGILDEALNTGDVEAESRAGILATAGALPETPDWQEWPEGVRGRSADQRLTDIGL